MKKIIFGSLMVLGLGLGAIFAQYALPDSIDITVKDPIIVGEATNLKITASKNGSKMNSYNGTILMQITDENGTRLKDNEHVLPNRGIYSFLASDLGEKEFQRGLEIKKDGTFYIEIQDLNDDDENILGKQLIHVIKQNSTDNSKSIDVLSPVSNTNLINGKVEVIAMASDLPNSQAIIYIDGNQSGIANIDSEGLISYTIGNLSVGQHTLLIEVPDLEGNIMGTSTKVPFTVSISNDNGIKNVMVDPEEGLMVGDMTNIVVYTDDMVESVKLKLSDRPENEKIVMNKNGIGEFSQNVFLIGTGEISLSFETISSNNTVTQPYNNYKKIVVSDTPSIENVNVKTDVTTKTAEISWETSNASVVYSYLITRWVEGSSVLSGKDWTDKPYFKFSDVPLDTIVNFNITPYRSKESKHGAASKTIQFVITKNQVETCGNGVCDNGESHELCPQDCQGEGETTIMLGQSCTPQTISTHTSKVGDSYYLIWDKAEGVKKYIVYSSTSPDGKDKVKVYETTDTSYEYPFDHTSEEDVFMYFRIVGICEDGEELELTGATKVQVGPAQNFFLLLCMTLLIYFGIKLFRQSEE